MKIAIAQINTTVGDLKNNSRKIIEWIKTAKSSGLDLVVFPELALTGYPPEDLLLKPAFIDDNLKVLKETASAVRGIAAVIGFADRKNGALYNAAAFVSGGKIDAVYRKIQLPNYGVFDEKRYFRPGGKTSVIVAGGEKLGLNICEDIWEGPGLLKKQRADGARIAVVINASPYHMGKAAEREKIVRHCAKTSGMYIIYANLVGGQDELVFDGCSMAADPSGKIIARAEGFREDMLVIDIPSKSSKTAVKNRIAEPKEKAEEVYNALVLGLRDYISKNGFRKAVLGLSGGIDSAIVAAIAVDAIGKENVTGVFMPSMFSSKESREDAEQLAKNLGINYLTVPIHDIFNSFLKALQPAFKNTESGITEENLQARVRGMLLMALSNKFGWISLTTGNKSEMSAGYATLYGDMAGGFAVIKDVPKTLVYEITEYKNRLGGAIPKRVFEKEPTAELKFNQKDSDTLPPYPVLDPILKLYIEGHKSFRQIVSAGFNEETVKRVFKLVDSSEYKRRQSPPGIKITPLAFGKDRRMPITNKYR